MVHVTSSRRLRRREAKDGRSDGVECDAVQIRRKYHSLGVVFYILSHRSILIFSLLLKSINRIIEG
jgi:hypothetical protein